MTNPITPPTALKLMAFDVDGVLTDGSLFYTEDGKELKAFNTLDGQGLKMLQKAGIRLAIITGRKSGCVEHRARNLGIDLLYQGVEDKRQVMSTLVRKLGYSFAEAGYMGDDVVDLPVMRACGFSAAPGNAHELVKRHASYTTQREGGRGAVREACEYLLQARGQLDLVLDSYLR